jgi:hypothetical protein
LDARILKEILALFCEAIGMAINLQKYVYFLEVDEVMKNSITNIVEFPVYDLQAGIQYLGFHLKENNYGIEDWKWLLS